MKPIIETYLRLVLIIGVVKHAGEFLNSKVSFFYKNGGLVSEEISHGVLKIEESELSDNLCASVARNLSP